MKVLDKAKCSIHMQIPEIAEFNSALPPSKVPNSMDSLNFAPGASLGDESKMPPPLAN
jgi:hypothetical protein